jgi:hypothetical protein
MKNLIIALFVVISTSICFSTSFAQSEAKIIKTTDVLSNYQLNNLADSTGMIYVPELIQKIMSYTPNVYYIDMKNIQATNKIIKKAKMHMIPGDMYIFPTDYTKNAGISKCKDRYGKEKFELRRIDDSILYIDIELAKRYKIVFASK